MTVTEIKPCEFRKLLRGACNKHGVIGSQASKVISDVMCWLKPHIVDTGNGDVIQLCTLIIVSDVVIELRQTIDDIEGLTECFIAESLYKALEPYTDIYPYL